jgi:GNAT superfamily N-acetyltransferase
MKGDTREAIIRSVLAADFPRWLPLWEGYNEFYGRFGSTALPEEVTRSTWARFLDPAEPVHALVAESGDELLGLAHYLFHRSTISIPPVCYLQDLFTVEHARGLGIGRSLIEAVAARAREGSAERLYWQTHESNHTAMRLYDTVAERSGFIVYRRRP